MSSSATPPPIPYGPPITLELAKQVVAAAEKEAVANNWPMVIAVVNSSGHLVILHKLDHAQLGSIPIAQRKAETAVNFKRPTKVFEEMLAGGGLGLRLLAADNVCPLEGGLPLLRNGEVIGGIGVSGMQATQDAQVAAAGANVVNYKGRQPRSTRPVTA
jgi:glc operon protein GlcG